MVINYNFFGLHVCFLFLFYGGTRGAFLVEVEEFVVLVEEEGVRGW